MNSKADKTQIIEAEAKAVQPIYDEATALIAQAIENKTDVATMEKLLAMRKELRQEKAKEEFDKAMAAFQAACPTIKKTTQGYNYKYAALDSIVEQVKDLLAENGFSYTFDTDEADNGVVIYCKVKHIGGHMEVSKAYITKEGTTKMNASQQSGAAMTYGKRYAFVNAFGILTGDEDTDAKSHQTALTPRQMAEKKEEGDYTRIPFDDGSNGSTAPQNGTELVCDVCGEPAKEKRGVTKVGNKPYHAIFCSTEDKSHTQWIRD